MRALINKYIDAEAEMAEDNKWHFKSLTEEQINKLEQDFNDLLAERIHKDCTKTDK